MRGEQTPGTNLRISQSSFFVPVLATCAAKDKHGVRKSMAKDFLLAKMPAFHVKESRTKVMFIFFLSFFFSLFIFCLLFFIFDCLFFYLLNFFNFFQYIYSYTLFPSDHVISSISHLLWTHWPGI